MDPRAVHDLSVVLQAPIQCWSSMDGQVRPTSPQGIYCGEERLVGRAELLVDGADLRCLTTSEPGGSVASYVLAVDSAAVAEHLGLVLRRVRTASGVGVQEDIEVTTSGEGIDLTIRLQLDVECTPMPQVAGGADRTALRVDSTTWTWRTGTTARLVAPGARVDLRNGTGFEAVWSLRVDKDHPATLSWTLLMRDDHAIFVPAARRLDPPTLRDDADPRLGRLASTAFADLSALLLDDPESPRRTFAAAGAPWFLTLFGRDSLWAARLLLPAAPHLAASTLRALASRQGRRHDVTANEQPGRIPHEVRRFGTQFTESPQGGLPGRHVVIPPLYYGTIDATQLWVLLLADLVEQATTDDVTALDLLQELRVPLVGALRWLVDSADLDGDGFVEYLDPSGTALTNQGWKDSGDALRAADGRRAQPPLALAEVQGYSYAAAMRGAALLTHLGAESDLCDELQAFATRLRQRFRQQFWVDDAGGRFPALALDREKRPVDAVASNMGHLLGTGLLAPNESALVVRRLMGPDMWSGYGIRTMSDSMGGYWPLSYHAGSVWAHDTAIIIDGMLREGFTDEARTLALGLLDAACAFDWRLPELFSGHGRELGHPVPYPSACRPQAWSAASCVPIMRALDALA